MRHVEIRLERCLRRFQLTHPTRGATATMVGHVQNLVNFNSHTPHGVRLESATDEQRNNLDFNSHTPHGVRLVYGRNTFHQRQISTHTPHTGCDRDGAFHCLTLDGFQLTHPTRGATRCYRSPEGNGRFQLTHPTRGATRLHFGNRSLTFISTHTPHTGCDHRSSEHDRM